MAIARRRPARFRFVVAFLILVSLTLITLDASGSGNGALTGARRVFDSVLDPVQDGVHDALRPIGNFLGGAVDYGRLRAENEQLRREVAGLRDQQASAAFDEQRADQVLKQADLPFANGIAHVTAAVVNVGSSNFAATVTIDKGTRSGVVVGQPVVSAGGLAGDVTAVTGDSATVTLVTDPSFYAGVRLPDGNIGLAEGRGPGNSMAVKVVPSNASTPVLKKGQTLLTSGLSLENYPPGIPVGRVVSAKVPLGETEPDIEIRPLVNAATLQVVQVLLYSPQTPAKSS